MSSCPPFGLRLSRWGGQVASVKKLFFSFICSLLSCGTVVASRPTSVLLHGVLERRFAQVCLGPSAPDNHLLHVFHVAGNSDFFLVLVPDERFLLELVQVIGIAIGIDNTPVR